MENQVAPAFAAKTDAGMVRPYNEDSVVVAAQGRLAILADGMGGYNAGEVASAIATSIVKLSLEERLQPLFDDDLAPSHTELEDAVTQSIQLANATILEEAHEEPAFSGMGTTVVVALLHGDAILLAHVGDSRAYRLRDGKLEQMTRDHSVLQEQIDAGLISEEMARFSTNRHLITRALGIDFQLEIEIHDHKTQINDTYLLCSDGLSDMLTADEISDILGIPDANLEVLCDTLIDQANANGGRDNISVILIKVQSTHTQKNGLIQRMLHWTS